MSVYPKISTGLGKLTPQLWDRLMAMLSSFEAGTQASTISSGGGLNRPYFLAKITGSTSIGTNRYKYDFTEVVLDESYGFGDRSGGRTGTDALNLCEMSNTASTVGPGVDVAASDYPAGFSMMPIGKAGDGTEIDLLVVMFAVKDTDGGLRSVFSMTNTHDGTC